MNCKTVTDRIVSWLTSKAKDAHKDGFVIGVSGGIDSALVSTLCAETKLTALCIRMPINQAQDQCTRAKGHTGWLSAKGKNVEDVEIDLTQAFDYFKNSLPNEFQTELALVNSRSRIRMMTLYAVANSRNLLVAGTGNKIEDFGIGFFSKGGDGCVDLSPIGDLLKSEVRILSQYLGVSPAIVAAKPTDGLWGDNRSDEDQIGDTYDDLELAMKFCEVRHIETVKQYDDLKNSENFVNNIGVQEKTLYNYLRRHENSRHKMEMPPICFLKGWL